MKLLCLLGFHDWRLAYEGPVGLYSRMRFLYHSCSRCYSEKIVTKMEV